MSPILLKIWTVGIGDLKGSSAKGVPLDWQICMWQMTVTEVSEKKEFWTLSSKAGLLEVVDDLLMVI